MTPDAEQAANDGVIKVAGEFDLKTGNIRVEVIAPNNALAHGVVMMMEKEIAFLAATERAVRANARAQCDSRIVRAGTT